MTIQIQKQQRKGKTLCLQASAEILNAVDEVMNTLGLLNRSEAIRFAIWYTNLQLRELMQMESSDDVNTKQRLIDLVIKAVKVIR